LRPASARVSTLLGCTRARPNGLYVLYVLYDLQKTKEQAMKPKLSLLAPVLILAGSTAAQAASATR
jgi:hypothetical protein